MRTSLPGLSVRQSATDRIPLIVLAVIVALVSAVATTAPRALATLYTAEVQDQLAGLTVETRDLVSISTFYDPKTILEGMQQLPRTLSPEFAARLGEPSAVLLSAPVRADDPAPRPGQFKNDLALATDADWLPRVRFTAGEEPVFVSSSSPVPGEGMRTVQFALSTATADALDWEIGEERTLGFGFTAAQAVLTGTFEPVDATAPYWRHNDTVLEPTVFDDGNSTPVVTGTGFTPDDSWTIGSGTYRGLAWYPLDTTGIDSASVRTLLTDIRRFASTAQSFGGLTDTPLTFRSETMRALQEADTRIASTTALLLMVATGPAGAALAVLALGVQVVADRRRTTRAIMRARGASARLLRIAAFVEGAAVALPAAVVGVGAALLVTGGAPDSASVAVPLVLAGALAALFAGLSSPATTSERTDLTTARRHPYRWVVEAIVVLVAVAALAFLLTRDFDAEPNVLVAALPLVWAVAVCLLVLRVLPVPLGAVMHAVRRRRGLIGFLGAARAVRDPAAGPAPVLALVVAVSVVIFSGILLTTISSGVDATARGLAGADLKVTGAAFDDPVRADIEEIDGVEQTAALDNTGGSALIADGRRTVVTLVVVDFADLRAVGWMDAPADGAEQRDGAIPLIVSQDAADAVAGASELRIGSNDVTIALAADNARGVVTNSAWVFVDAAFAAEITSAEYRPRVLLVDTAAGADLDGVAAAIADRVDTPVTSATPAQLAERFRGSPIVSGLTAALIAAMIVVAVLCAIALVAATVLGGRSRAPLLRLLATLGTSGSQSRALALWEIAPAAISAIVSATLLGIALPFAVTTSIDLRPFTGSAAQPSPVIDPVQIILIVAGFAAVAAASVLIAVASTRRSPNRPTQEAS